MALTKMISAVMLIQVAEIGEAKVAAGVREIETGTQIDIEEIVETVTEIEKEIVNEQEIGTPGMGEAKEVAEKVEIGIGTVIVKEGVPEIIIELAIEIALKGEKKGNRTLKSNLDAITRITDQE